MIVSTAVPQRSRMRWPAILAATVAVQAGLILWFSDRTEWTQQEQPPLLSLEIRQAGPGLFIPDPTLLALPSHAGFSGAAWRQAHRPSYESQPWTEPVRWLTAREAPLGRTLLEARRPEIGRGLTAEKPVPELVRREVGLVRLPERSLVRLEGDLKRLEPLTPLTAPSVVHSNILTESVVQVTVHPEGQVLSAVVLKSSGLRRADQQALELARGTRFSPWVLDATADDRSSWVWGRLIVQWRTLGAEPVTAVERDES